MHQPRQTGSYKYYPLVVQIVIEQSPNLPSFQSLNYHNFQPVPSTPSRVVVRPLLRTVIQDGQAYDLQEAFGLGYQKGGQAEAADGEDDPDLNNKQCVICMTNLRNVILNPCRHVCLCKDCAQALLGRGPQDRKCPNCRAVIDDIELFEVIGSDIENKPPPEQQSQPE